MLLSLKQEAPTSIGGSTFTAKATLADYADLNRRYAKTADVLLFEDNEVKLDIVPHYFFSSVMPKLKGIAFSVANRLADNTALSEISPCLVINEKIIIAAINKELGISVTDLEDAKGILEATLSDSTNQRRMEMEPVSRHLGQHLVTSDNKNDYCVFMTNKLNINVIADFRGRKNTVYYDADNNENFVEGMKIIPLEINELKKIIQSKLTYGKLYTIFSTAYKSNLLPREWYSKMISDAVKI